MSEITVVNLSAIPVQVAEWSLVWVPRWWSFWTLQIDVTPEETFRFKIDGGGEITLEFGEDSGFQWGGKLAHGRKLVMCLRIFGRRQRIKLHIA